VDDFVQLLSQGWIGNLLAVISIPLAIYFYVRPSRVAKPTVHITAEHALTWVNDQDLPPAVEVTFKKRKVPRISRAIVRFWNAGNEDLEKVSIRDNDPLRVELESDGEILSVWLLKSTKSANRCSVKRDPNNPKQALITFDFLGRNDGLVFGIIHTDSKAKPLLKGELRNCKLHHAGHQGGSRIDARIGRAIASNWMPVMAIVFVVGAVFFSLSLMPSYLDFFRDVFVSSVEAKADKPHPRWSFMIVGFLYCALSLGYFWLQRRKYPKSLQWRPAEGEQELDAENESAKQVA
jgi:hypothetical protein